MGGTLLGLIMDVLLLACMGWTIYFALKLSKNLENFRRQRGEFEKVIHELSRNIDAAQRAVESLKISSREAGDTLQVRLEDAGAMIDELQLMMQSGESLARRLEDMAARSGKAVRLENQKDRPFAIRDYEFEDHTDVSSAPQQVEAEEEQSALYAPLPEDFDIFHGEPAAGAAADSSYDPYDDGMEEEEERLISRAERELLQALRRNKQAGQR
ncbi:MAG: hypothetical protein KDJ75_01525 [Alphaproteobacteria bacterium]|nr:hypothetical protein [Alphaproteobacteria bacterium]